MRVFIANVDYEASTEDLKDFIEKEVGLVENIYRPTDRSTGRQKGYVFVSFVADGDGERAIELLNGTFFCDRRLVAKEATPMPTRYNRY